MQDKFNFKEVEQRLSDLWEKERIYKFDEHSKKEVYSIDTPPPTVSGLIHLGHVFSYSQADFIARYKRMRGYNVFYPFGFDNNGIPTEILVEKLNNTTAEYAGREKFIAMVDKATKEYEEKYKGVWRSVGISADWSLLYTTMGNESRRISQLSFLELNKMERVYRKETPTIWCPKEGTALSQMELKDMLLKSKFVKIKFDDEITIATTRPEMLPACVAIFVNAADKKNAKLIGRRVKVPIFGQEVEIIGDERVDPEKGTGVVMCCTFGDLTDIEWYKAYNLPLKIIISENGKMMHEYFKGLGIKEAREKIINDLKGKGYVLGEQEIEHNVNVHERCNTEIEFLVKLQWYIKYLDMKGELLELGKMLKWHPDYMLVRYENWVRGLQWDWAISRQRFYGVPFPVWYCKKCGEPKFAQEKDLPVNPYTDNPRGACEKCESHEFVPETDVLDTWATSSLTPLINARWKRDEKYTKMVYPMALRPQSHDIISFWLFTTVVKCYLHTKELPWSDVLISGHGLDSKGKPMHKSAGNVIEPGPLIEKYGADPLRYWASLSRLGEDASFQEKDVMTGARFVNKMWNVARFIEKFKTDGGEGSENLMDRWILSKAMLIVKECTSRFEEFDYAGAKRVADEFFWFFCDNYLEFIKYRIYGNDKTAVSTLREVFEIMLKLFAPFTPYITDEIYRSLYEKRETRSIHNSAWPVFQPSKLDEEAIKRGDAAQKLIAGVRQLKHEQKLALNAEVNELVMSRKLDEGEKDLMGALNIKKVTIGEGDTEVPETGIRVRIVR